MLPIIILAPVVNAPNAFSIPVICLFTFLCLTTDITVRSNKVNQRNNNTLTKMITHTNDKQCKETQVKNDIKVTGQ